MPIVRRPLTRATISLRLFSTGLAISLAMISTPTPVAASSSSAGRSEYPKVIVGADDVRVDGFTAASSFCAVQAYGYTIYKPCGFIHMGIVWGPASNIEWFTVRSSDYAVWHIWPGSGGWHSLGGQARAAQPNGAWTYADKYIQRVETYGLDNDWWCRAWPWDRGWYRCSAGPGN